MAVYYIWPNNPRLAPWLSHRRSYGIICVSLLSSFSSGYVPHPWPAVWGWRTKCKCVLPLHRSWSLFTPSRADSRHRLVWKVCAFRLVAHCWFDLEEVVRAHWKRIKMRKVLTFTNDSFKHLVPIVSLVILIWVSSTEEHEGCDGYTSLFLENSAWGKAHKYLQTLDTHSLFSLSFWIKCCKKGINIWFAFSLYV